jgi:3'-phosphoadenosine 5'-phosphosulfate sulfotransferase (PAPS reductase)/FAD synthetase
MELLEIELAKLQMELEGMNQLILIEEITNGHFPILVAFSGGKDSIALVLKLLDMGIQRDRIHLHHHEVDGRGEELFDWACTTAYCEAFAKAFGLQLFFSYRKGGILREINRKDEHLQDVMYQNEPNGEFILIPSSKEERYRNTRGKFPAVSADLRTRWCSGTVKITVMNTLIRHSPLYKNEPRLIVLTGERRQESSNRAKYKEIEAHPSTTLKRDITTWRSVIDMSELEVWQLIEKYKVQPHPAYMLGWSRTSCQLCIFSSPDVWASIAQFDRQKVERIAQIESQNGFTLYDKKNIWQKVGCGDSFLDLNDPSVKMWLEAANLKSWALPMIIENWETPRGAYKAMASGSL